jgi:hypothetical protein
MATYRAQKARTTERGVRVEFLERGNGYVRMCSMLIPWKMIDLEEHCHSLDREVRRRLVEAWGASQESLPGID